MQWRRGKGDGRHGTPQAIEQEGGRLAACLVAIPIVVIDAPVIDSGVVVVVLGRVVVFAQLVVLKVGIWANAVEERDEALNLVLGLLAEPSEGATVCMVLIIGSGQSFAAADEGARA